MTSADDPLELVSLQRGQVNDSVHACQLSNRKNRCASNSSRSARCHDEECQNAMRIPPLITLPSRGAQASTVHRPSTA